MFIKCSPSFDWSSNVDAAENIVCLLYGIEENGVNDIDDAMHSIFVKATRDLEMLPPIHSEGHPI